MRRTVPFGLEATSAAEFVTAAVTAMLKKRTAAKLTNAFRDWNTITSVHRSLYEIFGLPPLNLFDATSNDFADAFTTTPDYTPYKYIKADSRLYDWPKSRDRNDPLHLRERRLPTVPMDTWDRDGQ